MPDVTALYVNIECLTWAVQVPRDRQCRITAQLGIIVPSHHRCIPSYKVWFGVLVGTSCSDKVRHETGHAIAAGDVRHHDDASLNSSTNLSM
jgi:hypothetical protein